MTVSVLLNRNHDVPIRQEVLRVDDLLICVQRERLRRSVKLVIESNGTIRLIASIGRSKDFLSSFVRQHRDWIIRRVRWGENLRALYPPKCFRQGEGLLFLGIPREVHYVRSTRQRYRLHLTAQKIVIEIPEVEFNTSFLWAPQPRMKDIVADFYRTEAELWIRERVEIWSQQLKLSPEGISFRSQRSLWGSCSGKGHLSFNWKLIAAPPEVIDYVVVHELCHLRHRNHSTDFWNLVSEHFPKYRVSKKWLRDQQFAFDFLSKPPDLYISKFNPINKRP